MKADLSPKYVHKINETILLWFHNSNKYVVVSETSYTLIDLYLRVDNKTSFIDTLEQSLQIEPTKCEEIYNDISNFLKDANITPEIDSFIHKFPEVPQESINKTYRINNKTISVNFESHVIESLIHPQLSQYKTQQLSKPDITFDIFKTNDDLHLFKNAKHIGSYKTKAFHFLQGKFALELTNEIHNLNIEQWIATFHASTITNGKESIMIVGDSGNGKSTLSALLMANGLDLLADDFTPLYKDMNCYRYPAAISIKKGAFGVLETQFKNFQDLKIHTSGPKKVNLKYLPSPLDYKNSKHNFPCQTIVYVKYDKAIKSSLKEISIDKILETLIPDSWISPNEIHARHFLDWLNHLKCYQLNYSDNDFAISSFKSLFDS
ncbi:hypothetical protein [uncultured Psychroserpens sp.]|uniref:hypothetical protein n=1 Tax=uncultured Psychroserpens sp. TaxID=255436 RepID=UPI002619A92A|nr:hypothetical protein [uncultured Psychroserpens sp.]